MKEGKAIKGTKGNIRRGKVSSWKGKAKQITERLEEEQDSKVELFILCIFCCLVAVLKCNFIMKKKTIVFLEGHTMKQWPFCNSFEYIILCGISTTL